MDIQAGVDAAKTRIRRKYETVDSDEEAARWLKALFIITDYDMKLYYENERKEHPYYAD